ncbi:hypothetical protein OG897_06315 [Streptomyces sp. NBC_00237]|uniref:hypothetical protein n=1 Tax=Streptomyces sp. NBC_00237 TaxID=2975687 RepID=UPI002257AE87|nr:hypothetical protein [Streptomyces sp. NBC_00237]MCX5201076.1 hypothetical protein [Streptomyces sp. NBC_00237]
MTAVTYLAIRCDALDEAEVPCDTEHSAPIRAQNPTELRRRLKATGWRRTRDGRDLCPNCAEENQ